MDGGQHKQRVEVLAGHDGGAVGHDGHDAQHEAEAVEEGHRQAHLLRFREPLALADEEAVVQNVVVGEHHALGKARGARGVLHVDDLVAAQCFSNIRELLVFPVGAQQEQFGRIEHAPVLLGTDEDDVLQMGEALAPQVSPLGFLQFGNQLVDHLHVVAVAKSIHQAEGVDVRLADQELQLVELVVGVDGHQSHADLGRGEEDGEPVRHIVAPDAQVVALAQADGQEALGHVVHAVVELAVGEAEIAVWIDNEFFLGEARNLLFQDRADRLVDECHAWSPIRKVRRPPPGSGRLRHRRRAHGAARWSPGRCCRPPPAGSGPCRKRSRSGR